MTKKVYDYSLELSKQDRLDDNIVDEIVSVVASKMADKVDRLYADFVKNRKPDWISEKDFATLIEVEYYPLDIEPIDNGFSVNQDFKVGIKRPRGMSDEGFEKYKEILLNS